LPFAPLLPGRRSGMQEPDEQTWSKVPGQTTEDVAGGDYDEEDAEEKESKSRADTGIKRVAELLGDRWLDVPSIDFSPVPLGYSAETLPPRVPPSKWGQQGPPLSFRMEHVRAPVVRDTLVANGLTQTRGKDWLVMWSGPRMRDKEYQGLHELQRVNHFPGSTELTRKDRICAHFERMERRFGSDSFNFLPKTYVLPKQRDLFMEAAEGKNHIWIVKPHASSQGKGIYLLKDLTQLPSDENEINVVSRYIDNPLLIQGLKFDLRVYVLVTSFEPLRAYVYREGLTRFASSTYSTEDEHLNDAYRHLTNYSINKKANNFVENQQANQDNVGHKWSFSAFNKHLEHTGVNVELMWARIMDLCLKTLISVKPVIAAETRRATAHSANCFELYGFDVLVDEELKPWLVEVNLSPSMLAESPLDQQVKSAVLSDTFNLVGVANASWRMLASAKLRSQILQMRHSMAMAGQASDAFRSGQTTDEPIEPLAERLGELSEKDLKMMAQAFKEVRRCNNFIPLYPTRETVKRYAPLMRAPSPTSKLLLRMLLGEDAFFPTSSEVDEMGKTDASAFTKVKRGAQAADGAANRASTPPLIEDDEEEEVEEKPEAEQYLDWSGINCERDHSSVRTTLALGVLKPLNIKASSRVVLAEYLVRVINVCRALRMQGRTKLAQSKAYKRLAAFRLQLSIWLRTSGRCDLLAVPSVDDVDNDFIDQMVSTCRASLSCVSNDLWAAAASVDILPQSPAGSRGQLSLPGQLPTAFAQSSRGEKVVDTVQGLSSGDLEFILQGPDCIPEFASFLGNSAKAPDEFGGFEELEMMIECCGLTSGPLSDLLHAFSSEEPREAIPSQACPEKWSPSKTSPLGSLPNIFSGMPLMAHAAAAIGHRHPIGLGRPPTLDNARSLTFRLAAEKNMDVGPVIMSRASSLPSLRPNPSPPKQKYHAGSLPPLASMRAPKQMQKPLRPPLFHDLMQMDIEF